MKVQIYLSLHLFLLLCIPVNSYKNITDDDIYRNMHVQQKLCGSTLANTMRELCVQYNGLRARRSISIECCKTSCSFYYLMKYFCKVSRVQIDEFPSSLAHPSESITESEPKVPQSTERVSTENNDSRQVRDKHSFIRRRKLKSRRGKHLGKRKKYKNHKKCRCVPRRCKEPLRNKIQKQPSSEELNHKPAEYGYIHSTRPPIIYAHSNTISRGVMIYEIPNQSNNSQQ